MVSPEKEAKVLLLSCCYSYVHTLRLVICPTPPPTLAKNCKDIRAKYINFLLHFFLQKMRELILTSSLKVRMEAENDMLTKTLGK